MVELWLPYGDTEVPVRVPDGNLLGSVLPGDCEGIGDIQQKVEEVLRTPNHGKQFSQFLDGKDKIAIIVEDPRGLLPLEPLLTPVLLELESVGIEKENVSVLFAWTDRGSGNIPKTDRELQRQIPEDIQIFSHDPDMSEVLPLESTSAGTNLEINEIFVKSDIRIVLGEVRFDNLAGYTGLGTAVVPGLASSQTIRKTWSLALGGGGGRGVIEDNPLSQDIMEASKIARVDFLLSIVLGREKMVAGVFGGEPRGSFQE